VCINIRSNKRRKEREQEVVVGLVDVGAEERRMDAVFAKGIYVGVRAVIAP
jgi:hypothetical protein